MALPNYEGKQPISEPSEPSDTDIVAHDDAGKPITRTDLHHESYSKPLDGMPLNLLPPFDSEDDEEEWEEKQLIEAVKERRRRVAR